MQPQAMVTLTYPPHFLSTAATIKSYFNHHPVVEVVIVIDDTNLIKLPGINNTFVEWPDYVNDCKELYGSLGHLCSYVRLSQIPLFTSSKIASSIGWLRQQMVKFYMDQLLPDLESWFFTDGDMFFFETLPDATPYSAITGYYPSWIKYVADTLQIAPELVKHSVDYLHVNNRSNEITVSNPPWRHMSAAVLQGLRQYIELKHNVDFMQYHNTYAESNGNQQCSWSEWELIELYQTHILQRPNQLKFCPPMPFQREPPTNYRSPFKSTMLNLPAECDMGRDWFESMGVAVSDDHWQKACKIKK